MKIGKLVLKWNVSDIINQDCIDIYWEDETNYLTDIIKRKNKTEIEYWYCIVKSFGWDNRNGHKYIKANNGLELLREVLPNTECTFKIFNYGNGLAIQNWHHDSCTGNEWYYMLPISENVFNNQNYKGHLKGGLK